MDNQSQWLLNYLDNLEDDFKPMEQAVDSLIQYANPNYKYDSKNKRLREWNPDPFELYALAAKIFIGCLLTPEKLTYQAMIGYICEEVNCAEPLDRAKCAAECIAICYAADLIVITKENDDFMYISTEYEVDEDIPELEKHIPKAYKPMEKSINRILGNRFKQHSKNICTQHLDTLNNIPLCLEDRLLDINLEVTKDTLETKEEKDQWDTFKRRSEYMYSHVINGMNNEFYLDHAYDTRGRCYCEGYYINYQGSSFKKALVQLANKEIINLTN